MPTDSVYYQMIFMCKKKNDLFIYLAIVWGKAPLRALCPTSLGALPPRMGQRGQLLNISKWLRNTNTNNFCTMTGMYR